MKVVTLPVGQLQTNCYLVEDSGEVGIIDPGDDGDFIIRKIADLEAKPVWIALTHAHFDHVLAVTELSLAFKIPVYLHPDDIFLLKDAKRSAEYFLKIDADPVVAETESLLEGAELAVGKAKLKVKTAPGHTPGGICLYNEPSQVEVSRLPRTKVGPRDKEEKVLFCGDLMFAGGGVGRTDFRYCSTADLKKSVKDMLKLPGETRVYPGHGEESTVGELNRYMV